MVEKKEISPTLWNLFENEEDDPIVISAKNEIEADRLYKDLFKRQKLKYVFPNQYDDISEQLGELKITSKEIANIQVSKSLKEKILGKEEISLKEILAMQQATPSDIELILNFCMRKRKTK